MKSARLPLLTRLWAFSAMLCMALTLGMGVTNMQANASVLAHMACGDHQLSDGGWVCNCEPGEAACLKHIPDDGQGNDEGMLEMHHHHAETPAGNPATPMAAYSPGLWSEGLISPPRLPALHGIAPSQADQPPKI